MQTRPFPACTCGRMVTMVSALVLAGAGAIATLGHGPHLRWLIPISLLLTVGGGLTSALVGMADDLKESTGILLVMPLAATAMVAATPVLPRGGLAVGAPLFALAAVGVWWVLLGYRRFGRAA